jgi:HPt (histidine-containing phosphotransfer) domain-containing protein
MKNFPDIHPATASGDLKQLRQVAHKLAGASSYCGTPALNHQAKQVEAFAKKGDVESLAKAVDGLLKQIERLQALNKNGTLTEGENLIY